MLAKFMVCRERFRLRVVEGLHEIPEWDHKIEFGSMWHACAETHACGKPWKPALVAYCLKLKQDYPESLDDIEKYQYLCEKQFEVYLQGQRARPQRKLDTDILQEQAFYYPYELPSGRKVILRGKYDAIIQGSRNQLYVEDHKTKGYVDTTRTAETLFGNLQMMLYHVVARGSIVDYGGVKCLGNLQFSEPIPLSGNYRNYKFVGTRYNVVRRPLAEKQPIRQKKSETYKQFLNRAIQLVKDNYDHYFIPMSMEISDHHVLRFRQRILDPWLEALCDWWTYISGDPFNPWQPPLPAANTVHYQTPWGVFNPLFGGFEGEFYHLLAKNTYRQTYRVTNLFPELEPEDDHAPAKIPHHRKDSQEKFTANKRSQNGNRGAVASSAGRRANGGSRHRKDGSRRPIPKR